MTLLFQKQPCSKSYLLVSIHWFLGCGTTYDNITVQHNSAEQKKTTIRLSDIVRQCVAICVYQYAM